MTVQLETDLEQWISRMMRTRQMTAEQAINHVLREAYPLFAGSKSLAEYNAGERK